MGGRSLVFPVVLFLGVGRCGPSHFSPEEQTTNNVHRVFAGVARYRDSVGVLPHQLADVCRMSMGWCQQDSARWARDGWGQPLEYTATDTGYELRSLGADATPNTGDEISFSFEQEQRLVRALTGCYRLVRVPPGVSAEQLVLDTTRDAPAEYRLLPRMGYRRAVWYPVPPDGVWLEWSTPPSGILVELRESGDSLVGTGTAGSDFLAGRQGEAVAHRGACP